MVNLHGQPPLIFLSLFLFLFSYQNFVTMPKAKQIKGLGALLKTKQRYTASAAHGQSTTMSYGTVNKSCLTSSTSFTTAGDNTGLIHTDSDRVRIKHIHIRGSFEVENAVYATPTGHIMPKIRQLVVWFYKTKAGLDSFGNLPELDEVLESIDIESFVKPKNEAEAQFTVLLDRTFLPGWWLGPDTFGPLTLQFDDIIPVNRSQYYKLAPRDVNLGGHFDSDVNQGQVTRGLPMLYTFLEGTTVGYTQPILMSCNSRVLYSE